MACESVFILFKYFDYSWESFGFYINSEIVLKLTHLSSVAIISRLELDVIAVTLKGLSSLIFYKQIISLLLRDYFYRSNILKNPSSAITAAILVSSIEQVYKTLNDKTYFAISLF